MTAAIKKAHEWMAANPEEATQLMLDNALLSGDFDMNLEVNKSLQFGPTDEFTESELKITSNSANGRVYDEVKIEKEGDDLDIGFSCKLLLDALRACGTEEVKLAMNTPLSCMVIRPAEEVPGDDYLYLVLPIRMKD